MPNAAQNILHIDMTFVKSKAAMSGQTLANGLNGPDIYNSEHGVVEIFSENEYLYVKYK